MAKPGKYDMAVYQGDSFALTITLVDKATAGPVDLTGHTALSQIRSRVSDDLPLVEFDADVDGPAGVIRLSLDADTAAQLPPGGQVWDVQTTAPDGTVRTWVAGKAQITAQVSR
jgi:hypothetical protein